MALAACAEVRSRQSTAAHGPGRPAPSKPRHRKREARLTTEAGDLGLVNFRKFEKAKLRVQGDEGVQLKIQGGILQFWCASGPHMGCCSPSSKALRQWVSEREGGEASLCIHSSVGLRLNFFYSQCSLSRWVSEREGREKEMQGREGGKEGGAGGNVGRAEGRACSLDYS